jgi:hypothetical protein
VKWVRMCNNRMDIFVRKIGILPRILPSNEHRNYLDLDLSREGHNLMLVGKKLVLVKGDK